jgi:transcriptional regulator with XRE-family HTH domain
LNGKDRNLAAIAARLIEARNKLGLTQREMAKRLNLSLRTYAHSEGAERAMDTNELMILADLGVDSMWLLTGESSVKTIDPSARPNDLPDSEGFNFYKSRQDPLDMSILAQIMRAIVAMMMEEQFDLPDDTMSEAILRLYKGLEPISDPVERRGALRYAISRLREDLRASGPALSKRQA